MADPTGQELTPLERAAEIRRQLVNMTLGWTPAERSAQFDPVLPPGSLILTAAEAEQVRSLLSKGQYDDACLSGRHYKPEAWDDALALLGEADSR